MENPKARPLDRGPAVISRVGEENEFPRIPHSRPLFELRDELVQVLPEEIRGGSRGE